MRFNSGTGRVTITHALVKFVCVRLASTLKPLPCARTFRTNRRGFAPMFSSRRAVCTGLSTSLERTCGRFGRDNSLDATSVLFSNSVHT